MKLSSVLLILSISACGHIPVPDYPICRRLNTRPETKDVPSIGKVTLQRPNPTCTKEIGEAMCGYCAWTVSDKTQFVGDEWNHLLEINGKKKTWTTVMRESLTMPAETEAAMKAFAINQCKASGNCSDDISRWRYKLDSLDSVLDAVQEADENQ